MKCLDKRVINMPMANLIIKSAFLIHLPLASYLNNIKLIIGCILHSHYILNGTINLRKIYKSSIACVRDEFDIECDRQRKVTRLYLATAFRNPFIPSDVIQRSKRIIFWVGTNFNSPSTLDETFKKLRYEPITHCHLGSTFAASSRFEFTRVVIFN